VGGEADFDRFVGITHIDRLVAGEIRNVFVEWTPTTTGEPHACVKVDLINLVGTDTNPHDNWAQENLEIVTSISGSPFHPVIYNYNLTNPYDRPALFYFLAEGTPPGWNVDLIPRKIRLNPGERIVGYAKITPPDSAEVCTSEHIQVTSWTPRGDTLINVGGAVVQVDLRRPTAINLDVKTDRCEENDWELLIQEAKERGKELDPKVVSKRCARITMHGCMEPPIAGQEIILRYVDPLGNVTYRTVMTDENGCFEDLFVSVIPGTWQVSAEYAGDKCNAPLVEGPVLVHSGEGQEKVIDK
jgi:hypothetical protein